MIISQLTGGLGNQLFQYATGFAAASRLAAPLRLDLRQYERVVPGEPSRPYALGDFAIGATAISPLRSRTIGLAKRVSRTGLAGRALKVFNGGSFDILIDRAEGFDPRVKQITGDAYLIGCWQSEEYFADHRAQLLAEFRINTAPDERNAEVLARISSGPAICVHFRRTDYLGPTTALGPCSLDYYQRAFGAMRDAVPEARYYVFTDDPEWVSRNADLPSGSTLVSHNLGRSDIEDFRLMSACSHFIIANSSFSWWAAWLSDAPSKRVIGPATWYPGGHASEPDLIPRGWTRL